MPRTGHIWRKLELKVGASDVLAGSIKLWFKNTVDKSRSPAPTVYQQARETTSGGTPRFSHLRINLQRLLKREIRDQYPALPSDNETEQLIENAFDSVFKGKYQYDMKKERSNKSKTGNPAGDDRQPDSHNSSAGDLTSEGLMEILKKQTGGDRRPQWKPSFLNVVFHGGERRPSWLSSLPPELTANITDNSIDDLLSRFWETFSKVVDTPPASVADGALDIAWLESLFPQEGEYLDPNSPLCALLLQLASTKVACCWGLNRMCDLPLLTSDIYALFAELITSNTFKDKTRLLQCVNLLGLAAGSARSTDFWKIMFDIFGPCHSSSSPDGPPTQLQIQLGIILIPVYDPCCCRRLIRAELDGLVFLNTPGFFEAYFPPNAISTEVYQRSAKFRSTPGGAWPLSSVEAQVLNWFCQLTDLLLADAGISRRYCTSPNKPLSGSASARKLDLFLCSSAAPITHPMNNTFDWSQVLVICELKQNPKLGLSVTTIVELVGYVCEAFTAQNHRRFVHTFTLCGDLIRCWTFHRSGAVGSTEFSINKRPDLFIDVVMGYANMSESQLGFDTTIEFGASGMALPGCNGDSRVQKDSFFYCGSIASRGTTFWDAEGLSSGLLYILKDSWRSAKHPNEESLLAKAKDMGVEGIVEYIGHEDVVVDDILDDVRGSIMKGLKVEKPMKLQYSVAEDIMESSGWRC